MNFVDFQRNPGFVAIRDRLEEGDYTALLVEYRAPGIHGGDPVESFEVEVYDLIGTLVAQNASYEDDDLRWWIANTIEEHAVPE